MLLNLFKQKRRKVRRMSTQVVQNYLVRNHTNEDIKKDELECFISLIASLDGNCTESCLQKVMNFNSLLAGKDIRVQVDFENHMMDINYIMAIAE